MIKTGEEKACIENSYMEDIRHVSNIRVKECDLLIKSMTCYQPCSDYRKTLSAMVQRVKESDVDSSLYSKFTPNINFSKSQLKSKASDYAQEIKLLKQQAANLLKKVKTVVEKESVELSPELEDAFCDIVAGDNDDHPFDPDSPQSLLWQGQKNQTLLQKDDRSRTMHWHPVMIPWCLSIYLKSPGILFNSVVTVRLEHNIFWKLVSNVF